MLAELTWRSSADVVKKSKTFDTTRRDRHRLRVARRHLFVCVNARSSGKPACGPRGGAALASAITNELLARGATDVLVTPCSCLGPCFDGPNAVIYPDGVWYAGLDPSDAPALADHLIDGTVHAPKVSEPPGSSTPGDHER